MQLRIIVEVDIDETTLDEEFPNGGTSGLPRSVEVKELFVASPRWDPKVVARQRAQLAQEALDTRRCSFAVTRKLISVKKIG
jgi:hypothetical protein